MKRTIRVGLLTLLMAMWGSAADAWHWVRIGAEQPIKGAWYININSIQRNGNLVRAWFKETDTLYIENLIEYNCANKMGVSLYIVNLRSNNIIDNIDLRYFPLAPVTPNSLNESAYNFVCKK